MRAVVIGAGLSGLYASILLASEGVDVTNIAYGRGSLSISHGGIELWDSARPPRQILHVPSPHPYALVGYEEVKRSVQKFVNILDRISYPMVGKLSTSMKLLSPIGSVKRLTYAPASLARGRWNDQDVITLANLSPFRDFFPFLVNASQMAILKNDIPIYDLPLIGLARRPNLNSIDIARHFDDPDWRDEAFRAWKPILSGIDRIGLPAVLGITNHRQVMEEAQERLECEIFEMLTLPPSVPGCRLERVLRKYALSLGIRFIEGSKAVGIIDGRSRKARARSISLFSKGGPRPIKTDCVILASGGILNGGLVALSNGEFQESVFDFPLRQSKQRTAWTEPSPWKEQPYAGFGLSVNENMQPLGIDSAPIYTNVFAAGGVIGGADRSLEGSRQGIDIATASRAVQSAMHLA